MTWHETIAYIRTQPAFQDLVRLAYFDAELTNNVQLFGESEEFAATLQLLQTWAPHAKTLVDIGAGNGIAAVNFALQGYMVTAVEPDPSDTVGRGAIAWLQHFYRLANLTLCASTAENLPLPDNSVDIVYVRQAMHHAAQLDEFMANCARVIKKGGLCITVRDHVVFDAADKAQFLAAHPLHRYYGGENAFHPDEYTHAMQQAGLSVVQEFKHFDSVINYYPASTDQITHHTARIDQMLRQAFQKKMGVWAKIPFLFRLYQLKNKQQYILDERKIPGRMYSYICLKK